MDRLETLGYYQEQYAERAERFRVWNDGVWLHRWWISANLPCALCASASPGIAVEMEAICLRCLNEYPNVSWHPTGAVRRKTTEQLHHALTCTSHSSPPTAKPRSTSADTSAS